MLAFISGISMPGLLIILVLALLIFGNRLPEVARSMGRAMNEFKKGLKDVEDDVKSDPEQRQKLDSPRSQETDHQLGENEREHQG